MAWYLVKHRDKFLLRQGMRELSVESWVSLTKGRGKRDKRRCARRKEEILGCRE
jgi:hypothetical protein